MSVPTLNARPAGGGSDLSSPNVVKQTNDVRVRNGLGSLQLDPLLSRAAQLKAEDMAARGYFAHQAPDGRMPWDWIERAGYDYLAAAENLAVGYPTDVELISAWMESEGHRHNLLNQKYSDIGIGIAHGKYKGQDTVFVVQMLGTPRATRRSCALAASPLPADPLPLPAMPLAARDLHFEPGSLARVALESTGLPIDSRALPAVPFDLTGQVPLAASDIPVDLVQAPAPVLHARALPLGICRLPRALPRSRRLASILKRAH